MKKISTLFTIALSLASCAVKYDVVRKEANKFSPPGTVWLKDSLFIDQTEIRNLDYLEYLHWLNKNDPEKYASAVPDTNVWIKGKETNEPYVHYYLTHPAYRNFPVVGVSYEQAIDFCKWRSDRVMEFGKKLKHPAFTNIEYRLPTKEEWEYAATSGNTSEFGYEKLLDKNNVPKVWVKETETLFDENDILVPVTHSEPNKFGCYNMIGNVSEMLSRKGECKGGNVFTPLYDCAADRSQNYDQPTWRIGFRCVCVVKNR